MTEQDIEYTQNIVDEITDTIPSLGEYPEKELNIRKLAEYLHKIEMLALHGNFN